jgi:hypothetical protein
MKNTGSNFNRQQTGQTGTVSPSRKMSGDLEKVSQQDSENEDSQQSGSSQQTPTSSSGSYSSDSGVSSSSSNEFTDFTEDEHAKVNK